MKKNTFLKIVFLSLLVWVGFLENTHAQIFNFKNKLKVDFKDATLNTTDTTIVIKYDLKGFRNRYYNTRLFYSNNRGNSFKGPLRSIEGNVGDSTRAGKDKEIKWSFRKDNPYFDGKDIMFKIEAIEVPKIAKGGPENALRSLLIPGFGDTKVRNGYNYAWITALSYGCLGTGLIFQLRSNQKYNDYKNRIANSEGDHQNLYNEAKNARNIATGFFIAGASVWVADIIGVYFQGLKNKRRIAREKAKLEENNTSFLLKPRLIPATNGQISQLSLLWKF